VACVFCIHTQSLIIALARRRQRFAHRICTQYSAAQEPPFGRYRGGFLNCITSANADLETDDWSFALPGACGAIGGWRDAALLTCILLMRVEICRQKEAATREVHMTVKAILARKGTDVAIIEPNATLSTAVLMLARHRIGALVVIGADRRVVGIVSERDIVRTLAESGPEALEQAVAEVMTRKVVTCGERDTVAELMERMTEGKFRHVPVVEQNRLAGIVSIGDVVRLRVEEMEHDAAALQEYIRTA
jgi:CBS domain-containing protein